MTIDEALERFLTQLRADGRSEHTVRQYERHVRLLARWAADVGHTGAAGELSHEDLARFLASPHGRTSARGGTRKASSTNALRGSLRGFFACLHRAGYIAQDPCGSSAGRCAGGRRRGASRMTSAAGSSRRGRRRWP